MILKGHVLDVLHTLADESVDLVITSPPYYGHRQYPIPDTIWGGDPTHEHVWRYSGVKNYSVTGGNSEMLVAKGMDNFQAFNPEFSSWVCECGAWKGQLGREPTMNLYVDHIAMVAREIKRILKKTGSFFLNLGDSYNTKSGSGKLYQNLDVNEDRYGSSWFKQNIMGTQDVPNKSLMNIPHRVAIKLTDDMDFIERNDIVWEKLNALPGSWLDRLTVRKEYVFYFTKSGKNYFNLDAIREPYADASIDRSTRPLLHQKSPYLSQLGSFNRWYSMINAEYLSGDKEDRPVVIQSFLGDADTTNPDTNVAWHTKYVGDTKTSAMSANTLNRYNQLSDDEKLKLDDMMKHLQSRMGLYHMDIDRLSDVTGISTGMLKRLFVESPTGRYIASKSLWEFLSGILDLDDYDKYIDSQNTHALPKLNLMGKNPGDIWHMSTDSLQENHIAPYPRRLVARVIASACPPDGVVLDPFIGSGTVGVVAEAFNHKQYEKIGSIESLSEIVNLKVFKTIDYNLRWYGIELADDYVDIANRRVRNVWNPDQTLLTAPAWEN